jgi:hypothetical protein
VARILQKGVEHTDEYIDVKTDFGFKRFMSDTNTLLTFRNAILPVQVQEIAKCEQTSSSAPNSPTTLTEGPRLQSESAPREAVVFRCVSILFRFCRNKSIRYDLVCVTSNNEIVNVEMPKTTQKYCLHRALYYTSRLISRQGWQGTNARHYFSEAGNMQKRPRSKLWKWKVHNANKLQDIPETFHDKWMNRWAWESMALDASPKWHPKF